MEVVLPPGSRHGIPCTGRCVVPRVGVNGCGKSRLHRAFFFYFFACPGFFPFDPFLYCLNPFRPSCHFTFHITVLTTNTTQTSMPPVGFEPTILISERPKTHALDRTATGIGLRSPDRTANSEWLYRQSYSSPRVMYRPFTCLIAEEIMNVTVCKVFSDCVITSAGEPWCHTD
jgi:hypothetical protein